MTSLSHPLPHFPIKNFLPYDLSIYSTMPHLSHTSLMSPLVNPFVPSNILNLFQEDTKQSSGKPLSGATVSALRPLHIYDPTDPISALSVPRTTDFNLLKSDKAINEQSPSTQVVTSSTSDTDVIPTQSRVIVRNETIQKKKEPIKDEAYWERRRKNNDAAKRSRDSRRQKEDEMTLRVAMLEQENIRLWLEVEHLRAEVDRLRVLVLSPQTIISTPTTILHTPQPGQQLQQQCISVTSSVTSVVSPLFSSSPSTSTSMTNQ
ncbi:basic region leucine zipper [Onchocerca flexuosa]|uniref:Basic region leucine zipper n=1 Tax=Onchocerca flexuosa TaxID=387005 RepID=A0A238BXL7_9BILA|nr:basic region leucine zipper [Onchocerca flexuosa]